MAGKRTLAVMICLLGVLALVPAAQAMEPGLWEMTMSMQMEGMEAASGGHVLKVSRCMTKDDMIPQEKEKDKDCKILSQKVSGDSVTWAMRCVDQKGAVMESDGKVTYKGTTMEGTMNMTVQENAKAQKMKIKQTMQGRRTGPCK